MPNYRRFKVAGATYFFTVHLADRSSRLLCDRIDTLRWAYAKTMAEHPVHCGAMVILPDHIHAVWTLPADDADFSIRWRKLKARFSHAVVQDKLPPDSQVRKREKGIWQRRFWERMLRTEDEYQETLQFCRNDPVRHKLVSRWQDWPYSSFCRVGNLPTSRPPLSPFDAATHPAAAHG